MAHTQLEIYEKQQIHGVSIFRCLRTGPEGNAPFQRYMAICKGLNTLSSPTSMSNCK